MTKETMIETANNMREVLSFSHDQLIDEIMLLVRTANDDMLPKAEELILDKVAKHNDMVGGCRRMLSKMFYAMANDYKLKTNAEIKDQFDDCFIEQYVWAWEVEGYDDFIERVADYKANL